MPFYVKQCSFGLKQHCTRELFSYLLHRCLIFNGKKRGQKQNQIRQNVPHNRVEFCSDCCIFTNKRRSSPLSHVLVPYITAEVRPWTTAFLYRSRPILQEKQDSAYRPQLCCCGESTVSGAAERLNAGLLEVCNQLWIWVCLLKKVSESQNHDHSVIMVKNRALRTLTVHILNFHFKIFALEDSNRRFDLCMVNSVLWLFQQFWDFH